MEINNFKEFLFELFRCGTFLFVVICVEFAEISGTNPFTGAKLKGRK